MVGHDRIRVAPHRVCSAMCCVPLHGGWRPGPGASGRGTAWPDFHQHRRACHAIVRAQALTAEARCPRVVLLRSFLPRPQHSGGSSHTRCCLPQSRAPARIGRRDSCVQIRGSPGSARTPRPCGGSSRELPRRLRAAILQTTPFRAGGRAASSARGPVPARPT